jgi:hypothetical protein
MRNLHMFDPASTAWNCQFLALCVTAVLPRHTVIAACVYAKEVMIYHFRIANVCRWFFTISLHIFANVPHVLTFLCSSAIKLAKQCAAVLDDTDSIAKLGIAPILSGTLLRVRYNFLICEAPDNLFRTAC